MTDQEMLTPEEIRAKLKISRNTLYDLLRLGTLKASRVGGQWRVHPDDLARYLKETSNA